MSLLFDYEYLSGAAVHENLAGLERVPVPPAKVREWSGAPEKCKFASLSKEIENFYDPEARSVAVRYVREYPHVAYYGSTLLLVGGPSTTKAREWMASAVLNEITMRFCEHLDVTTRWIGVNSAKGISRQSDAYLAMRARYMDTKLLFMSEPNYARRDSAEYDLLNDILAYRWNYKLPTILTVTAITTPEILWDSLGSLHPYTVEMLRDTCNGYIAYL